MPWHIYIIACKDGKLYTGITKDLVRRMKEHNSGRGCRFTRYRCPITFLYSERARSRSEALKREAQIKSLPRQKKIELACVFATKKKAATKRSGKKRGGRMRAKMACAVALAFGAAFFAGMAQAADFSADMVSVSSDGSFTGKIYVSGEKSRMEMSEAVTISRMDKKVAWMLMPSEKMYMEQPIDTRTAAGTREQMEGELERVAEGKETLNGRQTTKYRVTYEAQGKRETVFQWIDEQAKIPVKTAAVDGSWSTEFKNIKTGPQGQDLFEIPAGYEKMSFNMGAMGGLFE